jgi:hypothetical protein
MVRKFFLVSSHTPASALSAHFLSVLLPSESGGRRTQQREKQELDTVVDCVCLDTFLL